MILRRVIDHFRKQEWTAIFLDFVIVVIGVFVGLQAQAWSVEIARKKSEREYLARLHDEVLTLMATRQRYDDGRVRFARSLVEAVNVIEAGEGALSDDQCDAIAGSAHTTVPPAELPTVTELLSTARLDQLTSTPVRTAILNYVQDAARARDLIAAVSDSNRDLTKAHSPRFTLRLGPSRIGLDPLWLNPVCDTIAMRSDPEFRNELSENAYMYNIYTERAVLPVSRQLASLHAVLDAEMGAAHAEKEVVTP